MADLLLFAAPEVLIGVAVHRPFVVMLGASVVSALIELAEA